MPNNENVFGMPLPLFYVVLSVISVLALILSVWSLARTYNMGPYAPVWETRPEVINFPSWENVHAGAYNPHDMPRQFSRQKIRALYDRHGSVINFPNWGLPGDQPPERPKPMEKNWWGYRST